MHNVVESSGGFDNRYSHLRYCISPIGIPDQPSFLLNSSLSPELPTQTSEALDAAHHRIRRPVMRHPIRIQKMHFRLNWGRRG
jgi:hypothetical protein